MGRPVAWIAMILAVAGFGVGGYKAIVMGYPLSPPAAEVWRLQCLLGFRVTRVPTSVRLALPISSNRVRIIDEAVRSDELRFSIALDELGDKRTGIWWSSAFQGDASVTYQASLRILPLNNKKPARNFRGQTPILASWLVTSPLPPRVETRLGLLLDRIQAQGATPLNQAKQLYELLRSSTPPAGWSEEDLGLLRQVTSIFQGRNRAFLEAARRLRIPARRVIGLPLVEGFVSSERAWGEIWVTDRWLPVDVEHAHFGSLPSHYLRLAASDGHLAEGEGVNDLAWRCLLFQAVQSELASFIGRITKSPGVLNRWSLYHLPMDLQEVFRILLLVPIGGLVVVLTRNVIGFPTFGTFMPILLAIAFRGTLLGYGIVVLLILILAGGLVRFLIDRLRLLLVPRLAVILTVIVVLMAFLSLAGERMGIARLMAVSLLPMVILTMTVERFFVVWQESGTAIAFQTLGGTLAVAAIGYLILSWETLRFYVFTYPELHLVNLALLLLLGRYTGYRLIELIRFRALAEGQP